jgi:hypothetical protein
MPLPTTDECWARDLLAAPRRERWAWVSARCSLVDSHASDLRRELHEAVDGKRSAQVALARVQYLRAALDQIERRLLGLERVAPTPPPHPASPGPD